MKKIILLILNTILIFSCNNNSDIKREFELGVEITKESSFRFKEVGGRKLLEVCVNVSHDGRPIDTLQNVVAHLSYVNLISSQKMSSSLIHSMSLLHNNEKATTYLNSRMIWHDGIREIVF